TEEQLATPCTKLTDGAVETPHRSFYSASALDGAECQPGMGRVVIQRSPARPAAAPMKPKVFEIKNYKVIADTGPVTVDPNLTALVGRNESGKTAILKA